MLKASKQKIWWFAISLADISQRGSAEVWARAAALIDVKVEIGGAAGVVAPLVGKQPPDTHIWILEGEMPVFLRSDGPQFEGGPIWRIELTSPVWPQKRGSDSP